MPYLGRLIAPLVTVLLHKLEYKVIGTQVHADLAYPQVSHVMATQISMIPRRLPHRLAYHTLQLSPLQNSRKDRSCAISGEVDRSPGSSLAA
ncbi:hypothetical protein ANAPH1_00532 [Anaplasma phagocytophilum]|nr:hypothetical protein ANAPH1_00532 [Anaplasma phagocytophilum]